MYDTPVSKGVVELQIYIASKKWKMERWRIKSCQENQVVSGLQLGNYNTNCIIANLTLIGLPVSEKKNSLSRIGKVFALDRQPLMGDSLSSFRPGSLMVRSVSNGVVGNYNLRFSTFKG
jgi:hypothetical protein